jgi:hypothetical protein
MRQQVGEFEKQTTFGLFQAHLQLRIFCNHGTYQKLFSWRKRNLNDEREAFVTEVGLNAEAICDGCRQPRPILGSNRVYNSFEENCSHVLCSECLEDTSALAGVDALRHCPLCRHIGQSLRASSNLDIDGDVAMSMDDNNEGHEKEDDYFADLGYSTKMEALVRDIEEDLDKTKR